MNEARHRKVHTVYFQFHEIILVKAKVEKRKQIICFLKPCLGRGIHCKGAQNYFWGDEIIYISIGIIMIC